MRVLFTWSPIGDTAEHHTEYEVSIIVRLSRRQCYSEHKPVGHSRACLSVDIVVRGKFFPFEKPLGLCIVLKCIGFMI